MEPNYTATVQATARRVIRRLEAASEWRALSFQESRQLANARRAVR
jgi:hypothetical protein